VSPRPTATPKRAQRINQITLARFEAWALPAMARRLPGWVTPDTLTAVAFAGAILMGAGYALAGRSIAWVHLASLGLVVHWWGDSLDGTLARVRQIRRERYGYYVDHQADAVSTVLLFGGLGAGGLMALPVALGLTIGVLLLMNHVNMVTVARGVFKISFGGVGPTEGRLALIVANTVIWAAGNPSLALWDREMTAFTAFGLAGIVLLAVIYGVAAVRETVLIGRLDPRPAPGTDGFGDDPHGTAPQATEYLDGETAEPGDGTA
jgi:phosphatidylglycerophosphate synthase